LATLVTSFLIYACGVLIVYQQQRNEFLPERSSIAAAVSNVVYGAPLGTVYSGVLARFLDVTVPLDRTFAQARGRELPTGSLLGSTTDGNGIGYIVVASLSMRLFGPYASSAVLAMLVLMGLSALLFVWRYPDGRSVVVVLYFTVLTIMLFTPLVWNSPDRVPYPIGGALYIPNYPANISIGGIRYFSLVAILPAFHLLLELADTRISAPRTTALGFVAMGAQVVILMLAVLVRNSAAPVIAAIATACLLFVWFHRNEPGAPYRILRRLAYMAVAAAVFVWVLILSVSETYVIEGRFTETLWHRIFVSFGLSPEWPFGNLREVYDCTRSIPEGLTSGTEDRNGHCILLAYAAKHGIPPEVIPTLTYSRKYDAVLREAFFDIARTYPRQTLKTFFYYKPLLIGWSIQQDLDLKLTGIPGRLLCLIVAALGNLLIFALVPSPASTLRGYGVVAGSAALLAAFTLPPYIAVWAMPYTSADLVFYCFFGLGLAVIVAIKMIQRSLVPSPS